MKTITAIACHETTFVFNHITKTIEGKEIDFKRAGIPGSEHEALLLKRMAAQPSYSLKPIKPKQNPNKKTYAGLNDEIIKGYILTQENAKEAKAVYDQFKKEGASFPTIKSWFLKTYKDFSVAKAKRLINNYEIDAVKKAVFVVKATAAMANEQIQAKKEVA